MLSLMSLSDAWARTGAIHSLPAFDHENATVRTRNNSLWNWGFLAAQILALIAHAFVWEHVSGRPPLLGAFAFAIAVYGWLDLSLCVVRKSLLGHLRQAGDDAPRAVDRIASAWLMFVSLSIIYANLYFVLGKLGVQFNIDLSGPTAAFAFSASTMTTVGYGFYSPVGAIAVILSALQALTGLTLISCVIAAAISSALAPSGSGGADGCHEAPRRVESKSRMLPWMIFVVVIAVSCLGLEFFPK